MTIRIKSLSAESASFQYGTIPSASVAQSASYIIGGGSGVSSSYAETASYATVAESLLGLIESASWTLTASYAETSAGTIVNAETASYVEYTNVVNKPTGIVSSSTQINLLSNVSSSWSSASLSSSFAQATTWNQINNKPVGILSSSTQINLLSGVSSSWASESFSSSVAISGTYALSSSYATVAQNVLGSITSASYALTSSYSTFAQSSSYAYTDWGAVNNKPVGILSSSGQINLLSGVTASWASASLSSSYATVAQNVLGSITSASYALTASYAENGGGSGVSSSYAETASYATLAQNVLGSITSASYALTASYAENGGGTAPTYYYLAGSPLREEISFTGPSIGSGSTGTGTVDLGKSFIIYQVSGSIPIRIRLYTSQSYRDSDVSRGIGTSPPVESGLICDLVLSGSSNYMVYDLSPPAIGTDISPTQSGIVSYTVTNLTGTTTSPDVTITRLLLETTDTGSISATSSSYALTASYADNAGGLGISSSYAETSSYAVTASYVSAGASISSSYAETASYAISSSAATSITFLPLTASYALTAGATGGGILGSGIAGRIALWTNVSTVTSSVIEADDTRITMTIPLTASAFQGMGSEIIGIVSSSYAETASVALNGGAQGLNEPALYIYMYNNFI